MSASTGVGTIAQAGVAVAPGNAPEKHRQEP
jgi:hypothetical protein